MYSHLILIVNPLRLVIVIPILWMRELESQRDEITLPRLHSGGVGIWIQCWPQSPHPWPINYIASCVMIYLVIRSSKTLLPEALNSSESITFSRGPVLSLSFGAFDDLISKGVSRFLVPLFQPVFTKSFFFLEDTLDDVTSIKSFQRLHPFLLRSSSETRFLAHLSSRFLLD